MTLSDKIEQAATPSADDALRAENERLREALAVLCFADMGKDEDEGRAFSTQEVWEIIYNDRVQDWFSYDEIEEARNALASKDRP